MTQRSKELKQSACSTIIVERGDESIADYVWIPFITIRDKKPRSKRGVSDYCIRGCLMKKWEYWVEIECSWINFDPCKSLTMRASPSVSCEEVGSRHIAMQSLELERTLNSMESNINTSNPAGLTTKAKPEL